jgi:hypothetical protein
MGALKQQYIEDSQGQKIAVILPIEEYNRIIEQVEELEDIQLFDQAKANKEESIPFDEYLRSRKSKHAQL